MALGQSKPRCNIADINVENAVAIDIAEIHAHPLERIVPEHAGFRIGEVPAALQHGELEMSRSGEVVQQAIRPKVVAKIDFGQLITVKIGRANSQGPAVFNRGIEYAINF